jgi:hypothetical protein
MPSLDGHTPNHRNRNAYGLTGLQDRVRSVGRDGDQQRARRNQFERIERERTADPVGLGKHGNVLANDPKPETGGRHQLEEPRREPAFRRIVHRVHDLADIGSRESRTHDTDAGLNQETSGPRQKIAINPSPHAGKVLSNAVAITWPTVGHQREVGVGKATQALGAMQDGIVLGTVLFELLDQFRDFEVIRVGAGRKTGSKTESGGGNGTVSAEQSAEFFYTDAKADAINGHHGTGDRIDLDILASLVQPLASVGTFTHSKDEDEWYDDSKLDEETERRETDAQNGKATGDERLAQNHTSSDKLEAAVKKLEHRLNRAATSIEDSLEHLENLQSLTPNGVARQIWMTDIGAFLAGRTTESSVVRHK